MRRFLTASVAGATALTGLALVAASPAFAATGPAAGTTVTASSAPSIPQTTTNTPVGDETINLAAGYTYSTSTTVVNTSSGADYIQLTVQDNASTSSAGSSTATVLFAQIPTLTVTNGAGDSPLCNSVTGCTIEWVNGSTPETTVPTNTIEIDLTGGGQGSAAPAASTLKLTNINYTTTNAAGGPVIVTAAWDNTPPPNTTNITTGAGASNAVIRTAPVSALFAQNPTNGSSTTTNILLGASNQGAGPWNLQISGQGNQWTSGDTISIFITDNNNLNCNYVSTTPPKVESVGFHSASTIATSITSGQSNVSPAPPTFTATIASATDPHGNACGGFGVNNLLRLTFTNSGTVTTTGTLNVLVTGVTLDVSAYAASGNIGVYALYNASQIPLWLSAAATNPVCTGAHTTNAATTTPSKFGGPCGPSNAAINASLVTYAPPSSISDVIIPDYGGNAATNVAINGGGVAETAAGTLPSGVNGYMCLVLEVPTFNPASLTPPAWDGTSGQPTVSASGGGAAVGPARIQTTNNPNDTIEWQLTSGSTTAPTTISLSNLHVDVPATFTGPLTAALTYGSNSSSCSGGPSTTVAKFAIVAFVSNQIFGYTADDTAAQSFTKFIGAQTGCPASKAAVLATDGTGEPSPLGYQDALTSQFVAGVLSTGVLLTPGNANTVWTATLNAIRQGGVTTVYVMGGPFAISNAQVTQLQNTPTYTCGGVTQITNINGQPIPLNVIRIYGNSADDTASAAAQYFGQGPIGQVAVPGAYAGTGMYNDTSGGESASGSAPNSPVYTAILATDGQGLPTGVGFQDADSASPISYDYGFPIVLTPPTGLSSGAQSALQNLHIQQVLVMGGPAVIPDSIVAQLQAAGMSVLRIAGQDFQDTDVQAVKFQLNSTNSSGIADGLDLDLVSAKTGAGGFFDVARGDFYTDSLVAGEWGLPLLLTASPSQGDTSASTSYLSTFLKTEGDPFRALDGLEVGPINSLLFFGGPQAMTPGLVSQLAGIAATAFTATS